MTDAPQSLIDGLADRYAIERELGRGGTATVYLARDLKHNRPVALKVLNPELAAVVGKERFLREIEITARLQHPHILPLLDSGEAAGHLYYVMPFVEGESLRDRLNRERQLPLEDSLVIARGVASALEYAHRQGLVHRDVKPENVLLSAGEAVVADFGIARAIEAAEREGVTRTGMAVGTPAYMSPEQAAGAVEIDGRSDLYALACVLYEMLAGRPPFLPVSGGSVVRQHLTDTPEAVTAHRASVPPRVAEAIARALAKTPADRHATAAEFAQAIGAGFTTQTTPPDFVPAQPTPARKRPWLPVALGAGMLAIAVAAFFSFRASGPIGDTPEGEPMLVVLPFENLGAAEDEYFADGITEEITSRLATVPGVRVIARTSAVQYKDTKKSIADIGRELGVHYVLEGTVRWQKSPGGDSRLRVTPQLIRVRDASHLWADRYDAVLADVFQIQSDIAEKVVAALGVALQQTTRRGIEEKPTQNLEAYDYYLKGKEQIRRDNTRENRELMVEYLDRAVEADPEFAEAWAWLSIAHVDMHWFYHDRSEARLKLARDAVRRALDLDPDSPIAHLAMGWYYYHGELDYARALEEFAIARPGMPSNAELIASIAFVERRQSKFQSAARNLEKALELDPRSAKLASELAGTYSYLRNAERTERYARRALEIDPEFIGAYGLILWTQLALRGDVASYRRTLDEAVTRFGPRQALPRIFEAVPPPIMQFLDAEQREAYFNLQSSDYDDPTGFHLNRAALANYAGRPEQVRAHAESLLALNDARLRARPNEPFFHATRGVALAFLGRGAEAVAAGGRATELLPVERDAMNGTVLVLIRSEIHQILGQYQEAMNHLESVIENPAAITEPFLRLDRGWDPVRDTPQFQRILEKARRFQPRDPA